VHAAIIPAFPAANSCSVGSVVAPAACGCT
jgi:hypothetical protein